jgi:hypothetical protein
LDLLDQSGGLAESDVDLEDELLEGLVRVIGKFDVLFDGLDV